MESPAFDDVDIFQFYRQYCAQSWRKDVFLSYCQLICYVAEIRSRSGSTCAGQIFWPDNESHSTRSSRDELNQLLKMMELRVQRCNSIEKELLRLMPRLDLMTDFSEFSCFYDFVFFICRENGQKNITVSKAVAAWRIVLYGRFRLLNQWCDFVEKNQRHNISEDTWQQVLAFSRCVDENLEGYDPEGAWPVLVDDFVEHLYRNFGSNGSPNIFCCCSDSGLESCAYEDGLPELREDHGPKRKFAVIQGEENKADDALFSDEDESFISNSKRRRSTRGLADWDDEMEIGTHSSPMGTSRSSCAVERCLSKGFAGLFSSRPYLRFNREQRVRYR